MSKEKGNLSINSENFLPIIKKWLYTDKDIFVRELASNGCDAINKLQKLASLGEADIPEDTKFKVTFTVDEAAGTICVKDNGIGMTADEIKKYINQIAFSGASDFLSKYKDKMGADSDIIGHFGLGFYSAFMVADKIEINTLSYLPEAKSALWICEGGIEYEMDKGTLTERGTEITLFIGEDGKEFLEEGALTSVLRKYCAFMPYEIYYEYISAPVEKEEGEEAPKPEEAEDEFEKAEPLPINTTHPLWLKQPKDCTSEDYINFYHSVFFDMNDPLFWIHLNMDYPFRLKGILYFPKMVNDMDVMEGMVKLYSNQVYIADNIKEVIPEFLLLLKGIMDCPDLPLNVSRSMLQNDGYAKKMSDYILRKVADKLTSMFKNEREQYEKFWDDISMFIKYGCVKEEKFYDKVKEALISRTTDGVYITIDDYLEKYKDSLGTKVFYVTDKAQQNQYIKLFKDQGLEALILDAAIDKPFISFLEFREKGRFILERVDADISESLKVKKEETEEEKTAGAALNDELQNLFRGVLSDEKLKVSAEELKNKDVPAILLLSEASRRMQDLKAVYKGQEDMLRMFEGMDPELTLVLNKNSDLIKKLIEYKNNPDNAEGTKLICKHIYDLALMSQKPLEPEEMSDFIERSNKILSILMSGKN